MTEPSTLAARIRAKKLNSGPLCRAGTFIARLRRDDPPQAAELEGLLEDYTVPATSIVAVLAEDHEDAPTADMLNRHRRGNCTNCPAKGYGA